MAKAKTTNSDLDKRLKAADELIEGAETLISKTKSGSITDKEAVGELRKQLSALKQLKEGFGSDVPAETNKRVDQVVEKLRNVLREKKPPALVSEADKNNTLELLDGVFESLNDKLSEFKGQVEGGQGKKKGKNNNKEKWIENLSYHVTRLESVKSQYISQGTVEQDRTLQEILSYFQDYLSDAEYQQQAQTAFIDGLYESFEKADENSFQDEEAESQSTTAKSPVKEEAKEGTQDMNGKKSFMTALRQNGFENEARKIPKISEKDVKNEYNFFDVFETNAQNAPQDTDYYPNASTKEKISTKNIYPKRKLVSEQMFEKFDLDTLFFIFYFQKDTYEQFLAAKELKKRAWRFHKKYLTWFKRLEPPRIVNDDFEQGTYAFFDFEPGGWCQRRKNDFTFKYSYLENDKI